MQPETGPVSVISIDELQSTVVLTKRCNIVRLGFGDDLLPLRSVAVVLTKLRGLCLYSPRIREGVFPETPVTRGLIFWSLIGRRPSPCRESTSPEEALQRGPPPYVPFYSILNLVGKQCRVSTTVFSWPLF